MRTLSIRSCWSFALLLTLLSPAADSQAGDPGPDLKVVAVDCRDGDSVQKALSRNADRLVIEISGTCVEDVVIERNRVRIEGVTPDAALVGDATIPGPVISVVGAAEVELAQLAVRGGDSFGVAVRRNAELLLSGVVISDCPVIGLLVDLGSAALLRNVTVRNHGFFGAGVFASSITVNGVNDFSGNGQLGMLLSSGASLHTQGVGVISADDNGVTGVSVQTDSGGLFPSVVARRNGFAGLDVGFSSSVSSIGSFNDLSDNGAFGATVTQNSHLLVAGEIRDNGVAGLQASGDSMVSMGTDQTSVVDGSPTGVILQGASGVFDTITVDTMDLAFGTQVTFLPGATITTLTCDATVLTQGGISCPAAASSLSTAAGASRDGASAKSIEEIAREMGMPRPPYTLPDF